MHLSPKEIDGLLVHQVGFLAQKRLARGLKLNHPETVALISCQIQELIRDGLSVAELMNKGRHILGRKQVVAGVEDMIETVQVEATFPDGTKLVTVHDPICREHGDLNLALYGSFLPVPDLRIFEEQKEELTEFPVSEEIAEILETTPGHLYTNANENLELNVGRQTKMLTVTSTCDRPIQIGSHYPFIETNKYLIFDRAEAYGMRLNIPSGTSVRFEPGETLTIPLVEIAGRHIVTGGNGLCDGFIDCLKIPDVMNKVAQRGFGNKKQENILPSPKCLMNRFEYAKTYGPTVGDKIRLGNTSLVIEIEKDFNIFGDECIFGGGKVLREGMGQASKVSCYECLDTLITNACIIDPVQGIIKADVGIKDGKIIGIGKGGNPDIMDGVHPRMTFGAGTEVIAGEGQILTAGGIDTHVHFICPQQIGTAISSGITTMIGGGTGPAAGTRATTCSPGMNHIRYMIQSTDEFPLNFGFTGKGNTSNFQCLSLELQQQIEAGAIGLKLHEDWGSTPAAIDCALRIADAYDVQVTLHTDTLNESGCLEQTLESFKGRSIHLYHSEGAGGGHAPDIIAVCGESNVLPSSTNPTRPYTINTIEEHLDMLMVCHHLDKNLKNDVAFSESRIRAETMAAEDILHDMGAISMMSSDSQAMGRVGEVITRTWQTADKMKLLFGKLKEETGDNDNFRVKRYIAKYTINPAISHGIADVVGSIEVGKLADLVLWHPAFFGAKPTTIIKGGQIAWSQMGLANASIPTPEPVKQRKMFGAYGKSVANNSYIFVSKLSVERGMVQRYGITKTIVPVHGCRNLSKASMVRNDTLPKLKVDPESYNVYMKKESSEQKDGDDWQLLTCPPSKHLSLAQMYFIF